MTRVVVADDAELIRVGFAAILDAADDLEVVGTAADGGVLLDVVAGTSPDVAVVDVRMPVMDGIEATTRIAESHPGTRVLILTTFDLDAYVYDALRAGASGFLLKDVPAARLVEGVRLVAEGSMLLGPRVTQRLVRDVAGRRRELDDDASGGPGPSGSSGSPGSRGSQGSSGTAGAADLLADLTPREREVLLEVATGRSNGEIATRLFIAEATVKSHISELLRKLDARDRVQLVIAAYEAGLVTA